jgi:DNA helicase II / ATP-dependent DNA helicase PcrA
MPDSPPAGSIALDAAQAAVIEAPISSRLVVTAGPGTGKTRTLLARAQWLVDHQGLEPGSGLLVLSFSRAAVETVARRGFVETGLGRLPVRTLDSLAARILVEVGAQASLSFDRRIAAAAKALTEGDAASMFAGVRHLLVDEAQDVVGVRARFVLALLEEVCSRSDNGFTVLGDPAQAIFDWQVRREGKDLARLFDLLDAAPLGASRAELKTNHRMKNPRLVELSASFGPPLRSTKARSDWSSFRSRLEEEVMLEPGWTRSEDAAAEVRAAARAPGEPQVAVLCRSNAEVLWLAAHLQEEGVEVVVRHRAEDRGGAPWLAGLFSRVPLNMAPVPDEPDRSAEDPWMRPPADLLRVLRQVGLARNRDVDLGRLAELLRACACPEELTVRREAAVTVSTVHRAKGLEYDTVFVVADRRPPVDEQAEEEARVLYVAATRAREELLSGNPLDLGGPTRGTEGGRAVVCSWAKSRHPVALEVKVADSDPDWSPGEAERFETVQQHLRERVAPGDAVSLRLTGEGEDGLPRYEIVHADPFGSETIIGRTGRALGLALKREVQGRAPRSITGLSAEVPDTAALSPLTADRVGLGEHGLHLRARVYGLGKLAWS